MYIKSIIILKFKTTEKIYIKTQLSAKFVHNLKNSFECDFLKVSV